MAARQWMSRALGVIGLTALAVGCADDGVSLHAICPIVPDIDDNSCTWDASSDLCVAEGVLNVGSADDAAATSYRLNLKVESGLKARMRDVPPLGETNGLQIRRAEVELRVPDGRIINFDGAEVLGNPFRVSASGYVDPMGSVVVPVTIIGPRYVAWLKARASLGEIVAVVKLHGVTSGGQEVESDDFSWPIRIIRASPKQINNQCIPGMAYCLGSLGQDGFAQACEDSASSSN